MAATIVFNQATPSPPNTVPGVCSTARATFLGALAGSVQSCDFESTGLGNNLATISPVRFGSGATAVDVTLTQSTGNAATTTNATNDGGGRFNTTFGVAATTGKYLRIPSQTSGGYVDFAFSTSVAAFGFYVVDAGDFNGIFSVALTDSSGTTTYVVADNSSVAGANGNVLFWGIYDPAARWTSARLIVTSTTSTTDYYAFDDFIVAVPSQVPSPAIDLAADGLQLWTGSASLNSGIWDALYTSGMVISTASDPRASMNELVRAMSGRHGWAGGVWRVKAGHMPAPVFAMNAGWLAKKMQEDGTVEAGPTLQFTNGVPRESKVNRVTGSCVDPNQRYQVLPFPAVQDAVIIAAEGYTYPLEVQYQAATDIYHAQQLGKVTIKQGQAPLRMQSSCNLAAYQCELFDVGTLDLPAYAIAGKTMEVLGWRWSPSEGVSLQLGEITQQIYDIEGTLTGRDPAPNTNLPNPSIVETMTNLQVVSGTPALTDVSVLTRTKVTWNPAVSQAIRAGGKAEIQYAVIVGIGPLFWQSWEEDGAAESATIPSLFVGAWYVFRGRFITAPPFRVRGDWSNQAAQRIAIPPDIFGPAAPPSYGSLTFDAAGPIVYSGSAGFFELGRINFGPYAGNARVEVSSSYLDTYDLGPQLPGPPLTYSEAYLEDSIGGAGATVQVGRSSSFAVRTNAIGMSSTISLTAGATAWVRVMGFLREAPTTSPDAYNYQTVSQATDIHMRVTAFAA